MFGYNYVINTVFNGIPVSNDGLADQFANYFEEKITSLTSNVIISNGVYNGLRKINEQTWCIEQQHFL